MTESDNLSPQFSDDAKTGIEIQGEECREKHWYVMRDLKRPNAKLPAYKMLKNEHFEVFTPMKWRVVVRRGKRIREEVPVIHDLLFVHSEKEELDSVVEKDNTLQYRYLKGGSYCEPMVVRDQDMDKFMNAVNSTETPVFYLPEEITPDMIRHKVRIIGGVFDGYEMSLIKMRGSKKKRIFVELLGIIAVSIEVKPEFIQLI